MSLVIANIQEKNNTWIVVTTDGRVLGAFSYDGTAQRAIAKEKAFLLMRTFNCAAMGKVVG